MHILKKVFIVKSLQYNFFESLLNHYSYLKYAKLQPEVDYAGNKY